MTPLFGLSPTATSAKLCGSPKDSTTPTIWIRANTRSSTSSLSYAEVNQVKFSHAQLTEEIANT